MDRLAVLLTVIIVGVSLAVATGLYITVFHPGFVVTAIKIVLSIMFVLSVICVALILVGSTKQRNTTKEGMVITLPESEYQIITKGGDRAKKG